MKRKLYLACYDVRSPRRLRRCLHILKGYASGRQYSCFECYLTPEEEKQLLHQMLLETEEEDSFVLLALRRDREVITLGQGVAPEDEDFMWVG